MTTKWAMVAATAVLVLAGCSGSSDDGTGTASGQAAGSSPSAAADKASNAAGATTDPGAGGEVQCVLGADNSSYEVTFRHDGEASDYIIDIDFLAGDRVVFSNGVTMDAVQPGELVREFHVRSDEGDPTITRCQPSNVDLSPVFDGTLDGSGDVGACQNLRRGELGGFAYELTFTNSSTVVPAQYAAVVAIRNAGGERRAARLVYAKTTDSGFADVAPGEAWTHTDEASATFYEDGDTCEVVSVSKYTEVDFFADGATSGSLDADIGFATGSAELTDDAKLLLQPAVDQIAGSSEVCVEGFADSVGANADNLALSQARAEAVADFLSVSGVTAAIQAVGRGESEATADDVDDPALRRVDITLSACPT